MERKACQLAILFLALAFSLLPRAAAAESDQAAQSSAVSIWSEAPDPADIKAFPPPGQRMTLVAQLVNTHDVNQGVRALVTIDGRVTTVLPEKAYLNKDDFPEYLFSIQAPTEELSYQFVVARENQPALFSDRFTVRRLCLDNIEQVQGAIDPELQGEELLRVMFDRSAALDREAALYAQAGDLLKQIKQLLTELDK